MGNEVVSRIAFVCSDMWEPYLKVMREQCSKRSICSTASLGGEDEQALDEVRAA